MTRQSNPPDLRADAIARRKLLGILGVAGGAGLAGCGGGGDDDGTTAGETTTVQSRATSTIESPADGGPGTRTGNSTTSPSEDGTETTSTTEDLEVLERTFRLHVAPPSPGEAQYNPWNGNLHWVPGANMVRVDFLRRSPVDQEWQPEVVKNWNYRQGVAEFEMVEDLYWTAGSDEHTQRVNINADDWLAAYDLKNNIRNPDGWPYIEQTEKTGEYSFTCFFDDTYRRDFVFQRTLNKEAPENRVYFASYLERFREATSDDERAQVELDVTQSKEYNPHPFVCIPFEVTNTTETSWILKLREDEDPAPRWLEDINFDTVEIVVSGEPARSRTAFSNGELPMAGSGDGAAGGVQVVDSDVPFETRVVNLPIPNGPGAYGFNFGEAPTNNVHFRRAFAYMLDRQRHSTRFMDADRIPTGLMTSDREDIYLSDELVDSCTTYGYDSVMKAEATAEMEAGGFERDSEGNWLYKEGERAGQPMQFQIPTYLFQQRQANNATNFKNQMSDWGISIEVSLQALATLWDTIGDGEFEIALAYWGGGDPTRAFTNAFYPQAEGAFAVWDFPGEWEGPPMGEPGTPPDAASSTTRTYEVANVLQRIQIVRDEQQYREYADQMAWVFNQCLPMVPLGYEPGIFSLNTDDWEWPLPVHENPWHWNAVPEQRIWNRGSTLARD